MKSKIQTKQILMKGIAVLILTVIIFSTISISRISLAAEEDDDSSASSEETENNSVIIEDNDDLMDSEEHNYEAIASDLEELKRKIDLLGGKDEYDNFMEILKDSSNTNIEINSEVKLRALSIWVLSGHKCEGRTFYITKNITLTTTEEWEPIGNSSNKFLGTINGNGYTISGIKISTKKSYKGLIGYLGEGGRVSNVKIGESSIDIKPEIEAEGYNDLKSATNVGYGFLGAVVGYAEGATITNCINLANVSGGNYVGGIVGYAIDGKEQPAIIQDCKNTGMIKGYGTVGGIAGAIAGKTLNEAKTAYKANNRSEIRKSVNSGIVYGTIVDVGGIVGNVNGNSLVYQCSNSGQVTSMRKQATLNILGEEKKVSPENVGGIVGSAGGYKFSENNDLANAVIIRACINEENAAVYGYKDVGGIVGQLQNKSLGHAVARECINYSKKTSAVKEISNVKTAGTIAGQLGSPSDKAHCGGTVWNCYYIAGDKTAWSKDINKSLYSDATTMRAVGTACIGGEKNEKGEFVNLKTKYKGSHAFRIIESAAGVSNPYSRIEGYVFDKDLKVKGRDIYIINENHNIKRSNTTGDGIVTKKDVWFAPTSSTKEEGYKAENYQYWLKSLFKHIKDLEKREDSYIPKIDKTQSSISKWYTSLESGKNIGIKGDTLYIRIRFNERINPIYKPTLKFKIGTATEKTATYVGVQDTDIVYKYKLTGTETGKVSGLVLENSNYLQDTYGNRALNKFDTATNSNKVTIVGTSTTEKTVIHQNVKTVDGKKENTWAVSYTISGGTYIGDKMYFKSGDKFKCVVKFDKVINALNSGEVPTLILNINGTQKEIKYETGDTINYSTGTIIYQNKTIANEGEISNIYLKTTANYQMKEDSTVIEETKLTSTNTNAKVEDVIIDNTAPQVEEMSIRPNDNLENENYYKAGDKIVIQTQFSEKLSKTVTASNAPILKLYFGGNIGKLNNGIAEVINVETDKNEKAIITYEYTVAEQGDNGVLSVKYTGRVTDIAGNTANLVDSSYSFSSPKYADTIAPTVNITAKNGTANIENRTNANTITYTFDWSEEVKEFTPEDIKIIGGKIKDGTTLVQDTSDKTKYTLQIVPDVVSGNEGEVRVIVEAGVCKDVVSLTNIRAESIIVVDKKAPKLINYNVTKSNGIVTIETIFDEAIGTASKNDIEVKFAENAGLGSIDNTVEKTENKVIYKYHISGADKGTPTITLKANTVKDTVGNANNSAYTLENKDIVLEKNVIKIGSDEYSFSKNDTAISNFANPTYFKAGDIIKVTKNGTSVYTYTVAGNYIDNTHMQYMKLTAPASGKTIGTASFSKTSSTGSIAISAANIYFDTTAPRVSLSTDIEAVENNIYLKGKEIILISTTTEPISTNNTDLIIPEINVSFSKSGLGKYNYQGENATIGNAKYLETINNTDGTISWKYKYVIEQGDEGTIDIEYISGKVKDLAGNETNIKELYTPSTVNPSNPVSGQTWNNELGVTYEFYKNSVSDANKVTSKTYFKDEDKLIVVAKFNKVLYVHYGLSDGKNTNIRLTNDYKDRVPSLYLNGNSNFKNTSASVTIAKDSTIITYNFNIGSYDISELLKVNKLVLKNENNNNTLSINGTTVATNGLIPFAEKWYDIYKEADKDNYKIIAKNAINTNENINYIILDPMGVSSDFRKSNIYADTTAPTVNIIAKKVDGTTKTDISNNVTNADTLEYTFTWSEKVLGFELKDITVINGIKGELSEANLNNDGTYSYTMNVTSNIALGNEGDIQVIVEQNACKDIAGHENVRIENKVRVDKKAPTLNGIEAYVENSNIGSGTNVNDVKENYKEGDTVTIVATFSENIENSTTVPSLVLQFSESGSSKVSAGTKSGNKITYTYQITSGDNGTLSVKGFSGIVKDTAGNETKVTKRNLDGDTIIADTISPRLVKIKAEAPIKDISELAKGETARYGIGTQIKITAEFSEVITGTAPKLAITFGDKGITTTDGGYLSSGTVNGNTVTYIYTIQAGDNGEIGILDITGIVTDLAGNELDLSDETRNKLDLSDETSSENCIRIVELGNIVADTNGANFDFDIINAENEVTGLNNSFKSGTKLTIKATTDEYVYNKSETGDLTVIDKETTPMLEIKFGTNNKKGEITCKEVSYANNKTIFTYEYTILDDENGQVEISINENLYYDVALNGNKKSENKKEIIADTQKPYYRDQPGITYENGKYQVEFNEDLYYLEDNIVKSFLTATTEKAPKLKFEGNDTVYIGNVTGKVITFTGEKINAKPYLGSSTLCDAAGNLYSYYDTLAPRLEKLEVTSPETGTYKAGQEITIVATFDEKIIVTSIPKLSIVFGDGATREISTGIVDEKTITYKYTIRGEANDKDNGVLNLVGISGTVKDLSNNELVLNGNSNMQLTGNIITADTESPKATITSEDTITNKDKVEYEIKWNEEVEEFTVEDIDAKNGTIETLEKITDTEYKLTVSSDTDGIQSIIIKAGVCRDLVGNPNDRTVFSNITIDRTKPNIRAKVNGGNYVLDNTDPEYKNSVLKEVIVVNEEISKFEYVWSQSTTIPTSGYTIINPEDIQINSDISIETQVKQVGTYYLYVKVIDKAGNEAIGRTSAYNVKESKIEFLGIPESVTNQDVTVSVIYGDGLTENRKAGISGKTNSADPTKVIATENGTVYAEATDKVGNKVCAALEIVKIDKEAPKAKISYKENSDGSITATISFNEDNVTITNNDGNNAYVFKENGEFTFEFKDTADNIGTAIAKVNTIKEAEKPAEEDKTVPTITFNYTSTLATVNTAIGATITTDEDAIIAYSWDNQTWTSSEGYVRSQKVVKTPSKEGTYTLYAKATDKSSNQSTVQKLEFTVVRSEEKIEKPEIIFEDLSIVQVNGVKYVKVSPEMTVENLNSKINEEKLMGAEVEFANLTDSNTLKTGSELKLNGETRYVIIVKGDVNCDGKIKPIDVTMANNIRLNKISFSTIQFLAADINSNGVVAPIDVTNINTYRLGKGSI